MGHQNSKAISALRAYARDLEATARGGAVSAVGASKQDDASTRFPGSGAPHQLAIAAVVVCVVLLGGIGIAAATFASPTTNGQHSILPSALPESVEVVISRAGGVSAIQAVQAFNDLGMTRAVNALNAAAGAGTDSSPNVQDALEALIGVTRDKLTQHGYVSETDLDIALAIMAYETATRPPGLDLDRLPPGQGGTPPGQDPIWTPPGQDPVFTPPGQDPVFTPPGQDPDFTPPGQDKDFTPPGQDKENPGRGGDKP